MDKWMSAPSPTSTGVLPEMVVQLTDSPASVMDIVTVSNFVGEEATVGIVS